MSPFLFLQLRRVKNGILRSFKTPVRAFMTIFVLAYGLGCFYIFFQTGTRKPLTNASGAELDPRTPLALLTLVHCAFILYALPQPKRLFVVLSEADVANIMPVPVDRWRVFRFFLFARSYLLFFLGTVIGSVYVVWFLHFGVPGLFPHDPPAYGPLLVLMYVLFALLAIAGLMFWRMAIDIRREFGLIPKRLFLWCVLAAFALIGTLFFIHMREAFSEGRSILVAITQTMESFPLAFLMTPLRFLASLLVMRVDAGAPSAWVSVLFWLVFTGSGYRAVRSQRRYLYEYASRLADERREFMARMRDPVRSLKRRRRQEAVEVRTPWFLRSFHPRRARAILWRDLIIAWRSYGGVLTALSILFVIGAVAWWVGVWWFHAPLVGGRSWAVMVVMMALAALPLTLVSPVAMADLLRHAETQKPLPIGALETVAMHVLQWTLLINAITFAPSVLALILLPPVRHIVLTVLLLGWSFTHLFLSGTFWISLFNPDQDDPIQRMYGGLFSVLMMVVLSIPGGIVLAVSSFLHVPLAVRVPVALAVNGGVAWGVHLLAARKYERFVFTE